MCLFVMIFRAFSSSLFCAIIAHNQLPFLKIVSNFIKFGQNFQIFWPLLLIFNIFLSFFWPFRKIACMPLLSRIGPDIACCLYFLEYTLNDIVFFANILRNLDSHRGTFPEDSFECRDLLIRQWSINMQIYKLYLKIVSVPGLSATSTNSIFTSKSNQKQKKTKKKDSC